MNRKELVEIAEAVRNMTMEEYPDTYAINGVEYDVDLREFLETGIVSLGYTVSSVEEFDIQIILDVNRRVVLRDIMIGKRIIRSEIVRIFKSVDDIKEYVSSFDFDTEMICDIDLEVLAEKVA